MWVSKDTRWLLLDVLRSEVAEVKLSQQIAEAVADALQQDGMSQAELARTTGLSAKHINKVVNGESGAAFGLYDYLAHTLSRRWVVTLEYVGDEGEA